MIIAVFLKWDINSWSIKPCSDGISTDIRPPTKMHLELAKFNANKHPDFDAEIITSRVAILYYLTSGSKIKLTLYPTGRVLVDTRNMDLAKIILKSLLDIFQLKIN